MAGSLALPVYINASGGTQEVGVSTPLPVTLATAEASLAVAQSTSAISMLIYGAGDCVGGKRTLTGVAISAGRAVRLDTLTVHDFDDEKAALTVYVFNADPAASTLTDQTALSIHASDVAKVVGIIPVAALDYTTIGSDAVASLTNLGILFAPVTTSVFVGVSADATPTYAATTDLSFTFGFQRS